MYYFGLPANPRGKRELKWLLLVHFVIGILQVRFWAFGCENNLRVFIVNFNFIARSVPLFVLFNHSHSTINQNELNNML